MVEVVHLNFRLKRTSADNEQKKAAEKLGIVANTSNKQQKHIIQNQN